jgi:hypothetical protein
MPFISDVYQKYHDMGFEVISICTDPESDRDIVKKIEAKINAPWPLLLTGETNEKQSDNITETMGGLSKILWHQYGFTSTGQLLLLDKNGLLYEYGGILMFNGLEPIVKKCLGIE